MFLLQLPKSKRIQNFHTIRPKIVVINFEVENKHPEDKNYLDFEHLLNFFWGDIYKKIHKKI